MTRRNDVNALRRKSAKPRPKKKAATKRAPPGKRRDKPGRPQFEPTDEQRRQVRLLVGMGLTRDEVALLIINPQTGAPIATNTLARAFAVDLEAGVAEGKARVAQAIFRQAAGAPAEYDPSTGRLLRAELKPIPSMGIFWAKVHMGWVETTKHEHGGRVNVFNLDPEQLAKLSDAELDQFGDRLDRLVAGSGGPEGGASAAVSAAQFAAAIGDQE